LSEEVEATRERQTDETDESVNLSASFDAGWSKRGTGRSYNSNTGHGVLIGKETGKIISYDIKSKVCAVCEYASRKRITVRKHKCYKNWSGSSKAMEPALAVDMMKKVNNEKHQVKTLIMDNDTTTIARARMEFGDSIQKLSDKNHTTKSISNSLFTLANSCKALKNSKTRNYIRRMYSYAIEQCQSEPESLRKRFKEIVPHLFGEHDLCDIEWCGYKKNPATFTYRSLPFKKSLSDESLRTGLTSLTDKLVRHADKLAFQGSSQANESFNNIVASKAPKNK
jgi:hypothetical protein